MTSISLSAGEIMRKTSISIFAGNSISLGHLKSWQSGVPVCYKTI